MPLPVPLLVRYRYRYCRDRELMAARFWQRNRMLIKKTIRKYVPCLKGFRQAEFGAPAGWKTGWKYINIPFDLQQNTQFQNMVDPILTDTSEYYFRTCRLPPQGLAGWKPDGNRMVTGWKRTNGCPVVPNDPDFVYFAFKQLCFLSTHHYYENVITITSIRFALDTRLIRFRYWLDTVQTRARYLFDLIRYILQTCSNICYTHVRYLLDNICISFIYNFDICICFICVRLSIILLMF